MKSNPIKDTTKVEYPKMLDMTEFCSVASTVSNYQQFAFGTMMFNTQS